MAASHPASSAAVAGGSMVWNWDIDVMVLFPFWRTYGSVGMLVTCIGVGLVCFLLEWFKEYRHIQEPMWIDQMEASSYTNTLTATTSDDLPLSVHTHTTLAPSPQPLDRSASVSSDMEWIGTNAANPSWSTLQLQPMSESTQPSSYSRAQHDITTVNAHHKGVPDIGPLRRHDIASWSIQLIRTMAYIFEMGTSLVIMSIFMLLNAWISIAIICGTATGFFLFRMGTTGAKGSYGGGGKVGARRGGASVGGC
ncbi:hypothetical protein BASA61_004567 [Batrachochytrium salamandrivorans]|nr:hypothetical protein BASA62_009681 [Batrachochytrium salamandrivorans]KAH6592378.1 hypothetical protein BASA61_004567 [Batrachochytrium salamandrivorans]